MNGFVINLKYDSDQNQGGFWAGNAVTQNLDDALFVIDIVAARQAAGTLQNQFTDRTVTILPATKGVQLRDVVSGT